MASRPMANDRALRARSSSNSCLSTLTVTRQRWIEEHLGWSVAVVCHLQKPHGVWAPIDALIDWSALIPKGFRGMLPRR
jgi:hypothetical protein